MFVLEHTQAVEKLDLTSDGIGVKCVQGTILFTVLNYFSIQFLYLSDFNVFPS